MAAGKNKPVNLQLAQKRLGLVEPWEALLCLPDQYADCRSPLRVAPDDEDDFERQLYLFTFTGDLRGYKGKKFIANLGLEGFRKNLIDQMDRLDVDLRDVRGRTVTWSMFGSPWQAKYITSGAPAPLVGRILVRGDRRYITDVERPPAYAMNKVWVRYLGIPGQVSGEAVELLVRGQLDNPEAWQRCAAKLRGQIGLSEDEALQRVQVQDADGGPVPIFESFAQLLRTLHQPTDMDRAWRARLISTRLAALAVQASALRHHLRAPHPQAAKALSWAIVESLAKSQPEKLSPEQETAVRGIVKGLEQAKPLNALLAGDVGTGKTLPYLISAVAAQHAGVKVAIIAPTDLLANQVVRVLGERFGVGVVAERVRTGRKIKDHDAILIGTPGLVTVAKRSGYSPDFLIVDEQHKLSTEAREALVKPWTHVLEVSATPVPRSLAAALYGGMQIFNMKTPPVRKNIQSAVLDVRRRSDAGRLLRYAVESGQRAAVVYPRVDSDAGGIFSVLSAARSLEQAFPGKVAVLHGDMGEAEKDLAIQQMRSGERQILVGSTIMETGLDIPSMVGVIVRDADHFGISQLHQLRGRLARNGGDGWFVMMVEDLDQLSESTRQRLNAVASTTDGYALAEMDLLHRGFGDLDGVSQTGATDMVFKLVSLKPEQLLGAKLSDLAIEAAFAGDMRQESEQQAQEQLFG